MDVLGLLSSEFACSRLFRAVGWRSGVRCPRCGSCRVNGMGTMGRGLGATSVRPVGRPSMIRLEPYSAILG